MSDILMEFLILLAVVIRQVAEIRSFCAGSLNRKGTYIGIGDSFDIHVHSRGRSDCVDPYRRWF